MRHAGCSRRPTTAAIEPHSAVSELGVVSRCSLLARIDTHMNRPLWLNILRVGVFFMLPPAFLSTYLAGLAARHFGLGSGAQFLSYVALYVLLLLCWLGVFVLYSRLTQPPTDNTSQNDRNG